MNGRILAALTAATFGLAAVLAAGPTRAADPARPFKAYAPFVASDEGSSAPAPPSTPPKTSTPPSTPVPAPGAGNEINIQPQLDTANAVSKLVTYAAGGILTTTGADGSKYILTLPPNSVLIDVVVTMTPLKAAGGLPASGGLKAGVQLEPDGMALGAPATLDIVPASPVPASQEISFSYGGDGMQAYAYGLGVNASRTRFTIFHFSGWAIAGGSDAERQAFFQSKVDSVASQLSQDIAAAVAAERARQAAAGISSDEGSSQYLGLLFDALADGYEKLVKPAMDTAEELANSGAIDAVEPGLQAKYSWEHQMAVMETLVGTGHLEAERAALDEQETRILEKVRQTMRDRCFRLHEVQWGSRLFGLSRRQILSGRNGDQAYNDALGCLTFKLDFEATVAVGLPGQRVWEYHVRVVGVPVSFVELFSVEAPPVTRPLELLSFAGLPPPTCSFDGSDVHPTDPFEVRKAKLVDGKDEKTGKTEVKDVELTIEMGDLGGSVTYICPRNSMTHMLPAGGMHGLFNSFHVGEFGPGGLVVRGWEMIRGDVYAVKIYSQTTAVGREDTILELRHTPE